MYKLTTELLEHISERLQIKDKMPTGKVIIRRKAGKESFETFPFLLPNAAQITLDRRWNMAADEVSITIENRNGYYAPDYSIDKVFGHISQKDRKLSGYKDVMVPFNEMIIELGYGKETVRMFTGLIDKIKIDESPATLQIEGRNLIKKLFKAIDPIDSSKLTYENQEASLIIQDLCYRAGIPKAFFEVYEVEGKDFMINKIDFEIGIDYIDAINKILETMNHRLFCNRFGVIRLAPKLNYTQKDFPVLKLKDYVNLTQGSYAIDSSIVRNRIIVMGKEKYQAFEDPYLLKYCNDEKIAFGVEAPWADDEEKRWAVADSYFLDIRRKLRRMTVAIIGNPSLDVGDLVEVELLASQATSKYMVVAIQSSLSAAGYIDILDLEFVGKLEGHLCEPAEGNYSPPPGEDLSGEYNGKVVVSTKRDEIIQMAKKYIGVYYQWGGDGLNH